VDRILGLPAKYIQGSGALDRIGGTAAALGNRALVFADDFVKELVGTRVVTSLEAANVVCLWKDFGGECCGPEIHRLKTSGTSADLVIAIGGGKALDTGKAVSVELDVPFVSVPTIASTDGAVSSIAVEYSENHTHIGLATWVEARACYAKGKVNYRGGAISNVAMTMARSCHDTILKFGREALTSVEKGEVSEAVERVVEANIFLSGVGFENTGVAGAHAFDAAVSRFSSNHSIQHGERVALGVLFQLVLEGDKDTVAELMPFYNDVGLPTKLSGIGLKDIDSKGVQELATIMTREKSSIWNLPVEFTPVDIRNALSQFL